MAHVRTPSATTDDRTDAETVRGSAGPPRIPARARRSREAALPDPRDRPPGYGLRGTSILIFVFQDLSIIGRGKHATLRLRQNEVGSQDSQSGTGPAAGAEPRACSGAGAVLAKPRNPRRLDTIDSGSSVGQRVLLPKSNCSYTFRSTTVDSDAFDSFFSILSTKRVKTRGSRG